LLVRNARALVKASLARQPTAEGKLCRFAAGGGGD
jgi:hypothetical protein